MITTQTGQQPAAPPSAQSWFDVVKEKISEFAERFELTPQRIVEYACYGGIGFLMGVLFKKYARSLLLYGLLFAGALYALHYLGVINFDWLKFKEVLGMGVADSGDAMVRPYVGWMKDHIVQLVLAGIGFLIGYSMG